MSPALMDSWQQLKEAAERLVATQEAAKTVMAEPPKKHRKKGVPQSKPAQEAPPLKPEKGYDMDDLSYWTGS